MSTSPRSYRRFTRLTTSNRVARDHAAHPIPLGASDKAPSAASGAYDVRSCRASRITTSFIDALVEPFGNSLTLRANNQPICSASTLPTPPPFTSALDAAPRLTMLRSSISERRLKPCAPLHADAWEHFVLDSGRALHHCSECSERVPYCPAGPLGSLPALASTRSPNVTSRFAMLLLLPFLSPATTTIALVAAVVALAFFVVAVFSLVAIPSFVSDSGHRFRRHRPLPFSGRYPVLPNVLLLIQPSPLLLVALSSPPTTGSNTAGSITYAILYALKTSFPISCNCYLYYLHDPSRSPCTTST